MATFTGTHPPQKRNPKNTEPFTEKRFSPGHITYFPHNGTVGICRDSNKQQGLKDDDLCHHFCQMCVNAQSLVHVM